jgi:DNA-binding CsgD family transcriptional regulator
VSQELATTDSQPSELTSKYARLDVTDKARILLYRKEGLTQQEIAERIGCSQSAVSQTLTHFKEDAEDAIRVLLAGNIAERISNWDEAEKVAAKRGDHRPTKERLEMALPKLRPQPANSGAGGGGITINIGSSERPIALPDIVVSPVMSAPESETPQE